ncbi:MAG: ParB N-terminal domain-containing protein [Planctomycetia bacterium]|nr:ParB N-terminal domain-containing protein [Planctomycetia bacterium]
MEKVNLGSILFGDGAFDERTVELYVKRFRNGEGVASPVLYRQPDGRYAVIDGRHRIEAAHRVDEEAEVRAYVITSECTPEELAELRRRLNQHQENN